MLDTLAYLANVINKKNITWGVGGSLLLYFHQLVHHPNDIDLLVDENHACHLIQTVNMLATPRETISKAPFRTAYFAGATVNNTEIDIMGGFSIQHSEGIYTLSFDEKSVVEYITINNTKIPLASLEDWYVLYQLIPNKQDKVTTLEKYFKENGVKHPSLLEKALQHSLPADIREKIRNLIG
jgi:hypothetical protein